jgi:hypothetical protein
MNDAIKTSFSCQPLLRLFVLFALYGLMSPIFHDPVAWHCVFLSTCSGRWLALVLSHPALVRLGGMGRYGKCALSRIPTGFPSVHVTDPAGIKCKPVQNRTAEKSLTAAYPLWMNRVDQNGTVSNTEA